MLDFPTKNTYIYEKEYSIPKSWVIRVNRAVISFSRLRRRAVSVSPELLPATDSRESRCICVSEMSSYLIQGRWREREVRLLALHRLTVALSV